jgi:hypothetical protein
MSESKFTPGPWVQYSNWYIRSEGGCGAIATVCRPIRPQVDDDECIANANLIAAAPELLACLEELLEWICSGYDASIYDVEEAARVVKKAKGEE